MTLVWCTGWEHGAALTVNGGGLASYLEGTPSVVSTTKRTGSYALQINPSAATEFYRTPAIGTPITVVGRIYVLFHAWNGVDNDIVANYLTTGVSTGNPGLKIRTATHKIYARFWAVADGNEADMALALDRWYRIDYKFTCGSNPHTIDFKVTDDAGNVATATQSTRAVAADTYASPAAGVTTSDTCEYYLDDWAITNNSADYPLGPGGVDLLIPTSDGTHNNGANQLEDASGADINGSSVFAYPQVQSIPMGNTTAHIGQNAASGTAYVAVNFANISTTHTAIIGARAILAYRAVSATANTAGCIVTKDNFGTSTTVWGAPGAEADYSESSVFWKSVIVAGAVDDTTVNALAARMGYSSDATPDPWWADLAIEVAYTTATVPLLVIQDAAHLQTAESPGLTQHNILVVADATQAQAADVLSLVQHNTLVIADAIQGQGADNLTLTAHAPAFSLVVADAAQAQTADNVSLTAHAVPLIVADATHAQTADNASLTAHAVSLTIADADQVQAADSLSLIQHNVLVVADVAQAQTSENATLTVHGVPLIVVDAAQAQTADNASLTAYAVPLIVADVSQVQVIDNVTLTAHAVALIVADVAQAQTADAFSLVQHGSLVVADSIQQQNADNVDLTPHVPGAVSLTIQDCVQLQAVEEPGLTQHNVLAIFDGAQSQAVDHVTLTAHALILIVEDAVQAQIVSNLSLVQHGIIVITDILQAQNVNNVDLAAYAPGVGVLTIQDCMQGQTSDNLKLYDIIPYKSGPGSHITGVYGEWEFIQIKNWWP